MNTSLSTFLSHLPCGLGCDVAGCGFCNTLPDESLCCGSISQRQVVQCQETTGDSHKHVGHAELDLLARVGHLVAVTPACPRLLGERFALVDGQTSEVGFEVHGRKFTRG